MAQMLPNVVGHKSQPFDCDTITPTLPNNILYSHIYLLMCKGREDETLLSDIHKYMQDCKSSKVATFVTFVWRAFQITKANVRTSYWPNVDIDVRLLTYDIWVQSFQASMHKDPKEEVDANLDHKSLVKFTEFRNMKDMIVGGDGPKYYEENLYNY
jgi:hypothetical protein